MQWADSVFHVGKQRIFSEYKSLTSLKHKKKMKEIEKNFADTHLNKWNSSEDILKPHNLYVTDGIRFSPVVETNIVIVTCTICN